MDTRQLITYTVEGHSMYPRLRDGQKVQVVPAQALSQGDIVVFHHPFRSMISIKQIKRIVDDQAVEVCGTSTQSEDAIGLIHKKHIIGMVV